MKCEKIKFYVGDEQLLTMGKQEMINGFMKYPIVPFNQTVCNFFDSLSKMIRRDSEASNYPDILTFAFWCRRSNITKYQEAYNKKKGFRIGRGLSFHIAPSNVPVNFAFSLAFGLLSGNGCIIRTSSKEFPQTQIICRCINQTLSDPIFENIRQMIVIITYGKDKDITDYLSQNCDSRVIWGGDSSIEEIRKSPIPKRTIDINFADRFSFAVFDLNAISNMEKDEINHLAERFYNDTYLMDQNACSTPHLILWRNTLPSMRSEDIEEKTSVIKEIFWNAVFRAAAKYELSDIKVSNKYLELCKLTQDSDVLSIKRYDNLLYVIELKSITQRIDELRGSYGTFFEYEITDMSEMVPFISNRTQTCIICGIEKSEIMELIIHHHLHGVDRIVPVGASLDMDLTWDGYDMIDNLSRIIN